MAILRSVVDVNNGNSGWTKENVIDALETVFANLGMHGGTGISGVPQWVGSPTGSLTYNTGGFDTASRDLPITAYTSHYYTVISQGTTAYRMLKEHRVTSAYYFYADTDPTHPNEIRIDGHGFTTGQAVHWAPGGTIETQNVAGLTLDTIYYIIVVDDDYFKLAANATDAANDTAITLSYGGWASTSALKSNTGYNFRDINDASFDNRTINIESGDVIYFAVDDTSGGTFNLCGGTDDYDANKLLTTPSWRDIVGSPGLAAIPTNDNISSGTCTFNGAYWYQSENEKNLPDEQIPIDFRSNTEKIFSNYGLTKYIYCSSTESAMKGEIVISPALQNNSGIDDYWKYTVPASGGRSELKLRIYRDHLYGHIQQILINSIGSGWSNGEVFTIPGDQIGGSMSMVFLVLMLGDIHYQQQMPQHLVVLK